MKPFPLSTKVSPFMPDEGGRGKRQETTAAPGYCNSPKRKTRWFPSIRQTPPFLFCPRSAKPQANHDVSPLPVSPPGDALPCRGTPRWLSLPAIARTCQFRPVAGFLFARLENAGSLQRRQGDELAPLHDGRRDKVFVEGVDMLLQMVGTPRLELKPASDALS